MDYLAFHFSGERFAVSLARVKEVSILGPVTRVPGAAAAIHGLSSLRGSVVPVVNLAVRLGLPRTPMSRRTALIHANALVRGEPTAVGLMVEGLDGIVKVSQQDVQPPPAWLLAKERDLLEGIADIEGRLVCLLDVDVLVDPSRLEKLVVDSGLEATETRIVAPDEDAPCVPESVLPAKTVVDSVPRLPTVLPGARLASRKVRASAEGSRNIVAARASPASSPGPKAPIDPPRSPRAPTREAPSLALDDTAPDRPGPDRPGFFPLRPRRRTAWLVRSAPVVALLLSVLVFATISRRGVDGAPRDGSLGTEQRPSERLLSPSTTWTVPADPLVVTVGSPVHPESNHEVRRGDSLWSISGHHLGNPALWPRIFAANRDRIEDPDLISPGQHLRIPHR